MEPGDLAPAGNWSVLLGTAMEKRGVKMFYTLFEAFSHGMLKLISRIIQMVQSNTQGTPFELDADTCSEGNVRKALRQQQIKLCDLEFNKFLRFLPCIGRNQQ